MAGGSNAVCDKKAKKSRAQGPALKVMPVTA